MGFSNTLLEHLFSVGGSASITELVEEGSLISYFPAKLNNKILESRVRCFPKLFCIEGEIVYINERFDKDRIYFEQSVTSVLGNINAHFESAWFVIPLIFFLKRIVDEEEESYEIKPSIKLKRDFRLSEKLYLHESYNKGEFRRLFLAFYEDLCTSNKRFNKLYETISLTCLDIDELIFDNTFGSLLQYKFTSENISIQNFGILFSDFLFQQCTTKEAGNRITTPQEINYLFTQIIDFEKSAILDPFAGSGGTLTALGRIGKCPQLIGIESDGPNSILATLNLVINQTPFKDLLHEDFFNKKRYFSNVDFIITDLIEPNVLESNTSTLNQFFEFLITNPNPFQKALILAPEQFLYCRSHRMKEIRKRLVSRFALETVILFPPGLLLPQTDQGFTLLCLSFEYPGSEGNCMFIDASEVHVKRHSGIRKILDEKFIDFLSLSYNERRGQINEDIGINITIKTINDIKIADYDLDPRRFLVPENELVLNSDSSLKSNLKIFKVADFLKPMQLKTRRIDKNTDKLITYKSLEFANSNLELTTKDIDTAQIKSSKLFREISGDAILVGFNKNLLSACFLKGNDIPILLSKEVLAFTISDKIDVSYLISQLKSTFFEKQYLLATKRQIKSMLSVDDFLSLQIFVPKTMEQQQQLYIEAHKRIMNERLEERRYFSQELNKQHETAIDNQFTLISTFQHELSDRLPPIRNIMLDLKEYLKEIEGESLKPFFFKNKIRPIMDGEIEDEVDTVEKLFLRADRILAETMNWVGNNVQINDYRSPGLTIESIDIREFLIEEYEKSQNTIGNISKICTQFPEIGIRIETDKKQLSIAIQNIIRNAFRHGFTNNQKGYNLVFQILPDQFFYRLLIKNDGDPFPSGFSEDIYKNPKQFLGATGRSGLGGFIINTVIQKLGGEFNIILDVDSADPYKVQLEIKLLK